MPHFLRRYKIPLAIATGVMLSAGALFLGAASSHHFSADSDADCAYACSQLGHGYSYSEQNDCCKCELPSS